MNRKTKHGVFINHQNIMKLFLEDLFVNWTDFDFFEKKLF